MPGAIDVDSSVVDPLAGVDSIVLIDNGAHTIRIATIPYPLLPSSSSSSSTPLDASSIASTIPISTFPNAIARTRTPQPNPSGSGGGGKQTIFVSSQIHIQLDDYAALHLRLPHQSGVVVDWQAQKTIWDHVLTEHLCGNDKGKAKLLAGKAVVVTEAYANLEPAQYAMDLLLFEQYGANAIFRTTPAELVGMGTDAFHNPPSSSIQQQQQDAPQAQAQAEGVDKGFSPPKRGVRAPRTSTTSTTNSIPKFVPIRRPEAMLVVDLGYSYCHAIPIIRGTPYYPSIRRLDLGAKMLVNLLKETLSFQQLDMMDESWLITYIFAKTVFVAPSLGQRIYASQDRVQQELKRIHAKLPTEWSLEDLLIMQKYQPKRNGKGRGIEVEWRLPDYGAVGKGAGARGDQEERDRRRYGYPLAQLGTPNAQKGDEEWECEFISPSSFCTLTNHQQEGEGEVDEPQSLILSGERYNILEHLFNPSSLGLDQCPLPQLIHSSISALSKVYPEEAAMMWTNIVLIGGLGDAVGMERRLYNELRELAPIDVPVRISPTGGERASIPIRAAVNAVIELSLDAETARAKGKKGKLSHSGNSPSKGKGGFRWLTYAQWMNVEGGGGVEVELTKAANAVFYPPMEM